MQRQNHIDAFLVSQAKATTNLILNYNSVASLDSDMNQFETEHILPPWKVNSLETADKNLAGEEENGEKRQTRKCDGRK